MIELVFKLFLKYNKYCNNFYYNSLVVLRVR